MRRLSLSPELWSHVDHYAASHRMPVNKVLHFLGIPLLLVASLGLLSKASLAVDGAVPALRPNAAWIVLFGAGLWYVRSDWKMGLLTFAAVTACYALGSGLPAGLLWLFLGIGVVAHAVGHYGFEGKPPAVFSNPVAVLEAPVWLLATWARLYR
ncbi:MAG: DUF962 domain-containing protein [Gemmataceae bacterium]|nr:DUF962 domain-containing protein [Gemmataceae bacterium]